MATTQNEDSDSIKKSQTSQAATYDCETQSGMGTAQETSDD